MELLRAAARPQATGAEPLTFVAPRALGRPAAQVASRTRAAGPKAASAAASGATTTGSLALGALAAAVGASAGRRHARAAAMGRRSSAEPSEARLSTLRGAWAGVSGATLGVGLGLGLGLPGVLGAIGDKNGLLAGFLKLNFFVPELLGGKDSALEHWIHPANMAIVLIAMGGIGSYVGWQIRQARLAGEPTGEITAPLGARHELIMGLMTFFMTAGGIGGMLFTLYEGRPLLQSPHALTGCVSMLLLYAQAFLGFQMKNDDSLRSAHSVLGSLTMGVFALHLVYGVVLGIST
mmetsp:Transcript_20907/g.62326  ORF Transcript_20907/g.62326 Transcript_20907/m.62326 type:complete len:293 (-) Transcript_20907:41-919(-)